MGRIFWEEGGVGVGVGVRVFLFAFDLFILPPPLSLWTKQQLENVIFTFCHSNLTIEEVNLTESVYSGHAELFGMDGNGTFCNNSAYEGISTALYLDKSTISNVSVCKDKKKKYCSF